VPWSHWDRFYELALGFAAAVFAAVVVGGRLRDAFIVLASFVLCLAVAEAYALVASAPPIEISTPGYLSPHPVLGWGPGHPGMFHDRKLDGKTGSVIYDVDYTIDEYRNRQVSSAPTGPSVAFFGDSMTFGQGVPDAETLWPVAGEGEIEDAQPMSGGVRKRLRQRLGHVYNTKSTFAHVGDDFMKKQAASDEAEIMANPPDSR
jgi:hypothetical protein